MSTKAREHFHVGDKGVLHRCYHRCRAVFLTPGFWIGTTLSLPTNESDAPLNLFPWHYSGRAYGVAKYALPLWCALWNALYLAIYVAAICGVLKAFGVI